MEECLPQEMLEAILGKLDRETLCTARLVSRTFCAAASAIISSLTLRSPSQAVTLERFPCLGHVTVHHIGDSESLAQLDPRLRAVITHLTYSDDWAGTRTTLPELPGMPELRELKIDGIRLLDGAAVLHRLNSLEVLRIRSCTPSVAMTISTATWLTSLVIGPVTRTGEGWRSQEFSWLQHATTLRNLQALEIAVHHDALPLIGNLTRLTELTWWGGAPKETYSIAPLSRLCRLRSLNIGPCLSDSNLAIAGSLGSGSLAKLCMKVSWHASADSIRLLARQTALTHLHVGGDMVCAPGVYAPSSREFRLLGALRMELLQSLELPRLNTMDAEGLDALGRATSLTRVHISTHIPQPDVPRLSQNLGRLTQLRSLQLEFCRSNRDTMSLDLRLALGPLTALTELPGLAWTVETCRRCCA